MLTGKIEQFTYLSNFKSLQDFNNHMEAFLAEHKRHFTKSELKCLKMLARYSAKVWGVSNISISKLLKAVAKTFGVVSEATFHRMKRKAIKLGILAVHATERANKSQSSNVWVFQRWINNDTPLEKRHPNKDKGSEDKALTSHKAINLSNTNNQLNTRTESVDSQKIVDKIIPDWINKELAEYISNFYPMRDVIEFARISLINNFEYQFTTDEAAEIALKAFKQLVHKIKHSGKVKNPFGYFNGILKKKMNHQFRSNEFFGYWVNLE